MKLRGKRGDFLEVTLSSWDPVEKWMKIRVRGSENGSTWERTSSCLTADEALSLSGWMGALETDMPSKKTFIEPDLEFAYESGTLTVALRWGLYPTAWASSASDYDGEPYLLVFEPGQNELRKQASAWEREVRNVARSSNET